MIKPFWKKSDSDIELAIKKSMNDPYLYNLKPFIADDWLGWVKSMGISGSSLNLMRQLEEQHPDISNAWFRTPNGGEIINPAILAKWLVLRARKVGHREAYETIGKLIKKTITTGYHVTLISGLNLNGNIEFGDDIQLIPGHSVPEQIQDGISQKIAHSRPDVHPPYSFLLQPIEIDLLSDSLSDSIEKRTQAYVNSQFPIVNFLSLFSNHHAPCIDRFWFVLPDSTPMSGIVDSGYQSYLEIRPPKVPEDWQKVDLTSVSDLYKVYCQIPDKKRLPIEIALWRRSQAMNTWDDINKAIDLGIALESVLTSPKTREQLSLHIRLVGSKLVSKDPDERSTIFLLLKSVYQIRSEAVHNGTVEKSYKIKNRGSVRTSEILDEGIALLGRCIKEIIRRGGLTQDDFEALLLE